MEVRTDIIKETIVDGILYVFDDEGLGVNRTIEFGLPYESITFNNQAFVNNVNTRIICNGVELTAEQYQAVGAQKPEA